MTTLILLALNRIHAIFFCKLQKKIGIGGGDAERADLVTSSRLRLRKCILDQDT